MARLLRPYIPIPVRLAVARRQYEQSNGAMVIENHHAAVEVRLLAYLRLLFGNQEVQLDHHPALVNRAKVMRKGVHIGYLPDANDPDFLIWRTKHAHHIKTNVRGDGAQYPDRVLAKRERRRQKKKRAKWKPRKAKQARRAT